MVVQSYKVLILHTLHNGDENDTLRGLNERKKMQIKLESLNRNNLQILLKCCTRILKVETSNQEQV